MIDLVTVHEVAESGLLPAQVPDIGERLVLLRFDTHDLKRRNEVVEGDVPFCRRVRGELDGNLSRSIAELANLERLRPGRQTVENVVAACAGDCRDAATLKRDARTNEGLALLVENDT